MCDVGGYAFGRLGLYPGPAGDMPVEAIPMYVEELLLLLTCYVEGAS